MNLFTAAEKILLAKINVDYRIADKNELIENFTAKNLDTLQDTENKNINTKSNILAPFNSSIPENFSIEDYLSQDLMIHNDAIKFYGKVKELNRNYELNNNEENNSSKILLLAFLLFC